MNKYTSEDIDLLLEKGIDVPGRVIYFGTQKGLEEDELSSINEMTVDDCIMKLDLLSNINKEKNPITLKMNTKGGDVYQGLRLVDAIKRCPCQIIFEGSGLIGSSGILVLLACDLRGLTKNTTLLIHSVSSSSSDNFQNNSIDHIEHKRLQGIMVNSLRQNGHLSESFWRETIKYDLYLNAREALKLGLIDHILMDRPREKFRQYRNEKKQIFKKTKSCDALIQKIHKRLNIIQNDTKDYYN